MRRRLALIACLAIVASLADAARADPIMGTVALTVAPAPYPLSWGGAFFQGPVVYSTGSVDLSQLFQGETLPGPGGGETWQGLTLTGPLLVQWYGLGSENIDTTFDLKIAFDGAAGTHPTIDVTGPMMVQIYSEPDTNSPQWIDGASDVSLGTVTTLKSATVQGWTPESGIPMSLIDKYLTTSNYSLYLQDSYHVVPESYPTASNFYLTANQSAVTFVPEPATVLIYLAAIAGLGVWRGTRLWRSWSAR